MSTRTQYDADLAALKALLAKMGQLSADAVEDALESLCTAAVSYTHLTLPTICSV